MYLNLKAEIVRKSMNIKSIAMKIGITERSLRNKINGKTEFTLSEAIEIRKILECSLSLEDLFQKEINAA